MPLQISRQEAIAQSSARYFTGVPCVHGHIAERFTSSGACVECMRGYSATQRANRPKRPVGRPPAVDPLTPEQREITTAAVQALRGKNCPGRKGFVIYNGIVPKAVAMARTLNESAFPGALESATDPQWEPGPHSGNGWNLGKMSVAPQFDKMFRAWLSATNPQSPDYQQSMDSAEAAGRQMVGRANAWADSRENGEPK